MFWLSNHFMMGIIDSYCIVISNLQIFRRGCLCIEKVLISLAIVINVNSINKYKHLYFSEHNISRQSSSSGLGAPLVSGEFSTVSIPPVKLEEKERRVNAMAILRLLCDCPQLQRHLVELLSARSMELINLCSYFWWSCQHFHLKLKKSFKLPETMGKFPVNYFLSGFLKL